MIASKPITTMPTMTTLVIKSWMMFINQSCPAKLSKTATPTLCLPNIDIHRSFSRYDGVVRMAK